MKLSNRINNFLKLLRYYFKFNFNSIEIRYKYLELYKDSTLLDYIEEKARELADIEDIKIFSVLYDELNKDETDEDSKAVGLFSYYKSKKVCKYETLESEYKKLNKNVPLEQVFPRIEITEKGDVFTILHELGHYFIYKTDQEQSENAANLFIDEFFDKYLPPFFKWIYQIEIKVRGNMDLKFTELECYENWEEYCNWTKNRKVLNEET